MAHLRGAWLCHINEMRRRRYALIRGFDYFTQRFCKVLPTRDPRRQRYGRKHMMNCRDNFVIELLGNWALQNIL